MRKIMTREFCIHDTDIANRDCRKPQRPEDGQPEHWTTKRRQVYDSVKRCTNWCAPTISQDRRKQTQDEQ